MKLWYKTAKMAWYRTKLREISILVSGKGPFRLDDMDARVDSMSDDTVTQIVEVNLRNNEPTGPLRTALRSIGTVYNSLLSRTNTSEPVPVHVDDNNRDVIMRGIDRRGSGSSVNNLIIPTSEIQISQLETGTHEMKNEMKIDMHNENVQSAQIED